jgi:hypothetical protein
LLPSLPAARPSAFVAVAAHRLLSPVFLPLLLLPPAIMAVAACCLPPAACRTPPAVVAFAVVIAIVTVIADHPLPDVAAHCLPAPLAARNYHLVYVID